MLGLDTGDDVRYRMREVEEVERMSHVKEEAVDPQLRKSQKQVYDLTAQLERANAEIERLSGILAELDAENAALSGKRAAKAAKEAEKEEGG